MFGLLILMLHASSQVAQRPPAVPLFTHTPYFSSWSMANKLTDDWPRHWTGGITGMFGAIRVDGKTYRWCGPAIVDLPPMTQTSLEVRPLSTRYTFQEEGIEFDVTFSELNFESSQSKSRPPVTTVQFNAKSMGKTVHDVAIYIDFTGEWCTGNPDQNIVMSRLRIGKMDALTIASSDQPVLKRSGDRIRIDWGTLCVATNAAASDSAIGSHTDVRTAFAKTGKLPQRDDTGFPKRADDNWPVAAFALDMGKVADTSVVRRVFVGFDEKFAIESFGRPLSPAWKDQYEDVGALMAAMEPRADADRAEAAAFETQLLKDLTKAGGKSYADLGALAFRQCLAGHGLVRDLNGDLLMFSKENTSNGCIGTVDVIFPACPFFLYFSSELMKANLRPVLDYASMPRWKSPFAPHDLGTYPKANGQVYGGGEKTEEDQMPVEETANMLLMMDAVARVEKNTKFAEKYEALLKKWANYLLEKGFDPENQLCTDDFTGHLAHNANLSIKAIIAIRAYADILEMMGKKEEAKPFIERAQQWAKDWVKAADDGDHFRLAFDKPGTWSQKYNLVWDKLLGFNLFLKDVYDREVKWYAQHFNKYGLPLDSRATFTKDDWQIWTGSLTSSPSDFAPYAETIHKMLNETSSRVPFTDWHDTISGETRGMYARTVVGGVFMKLLMDSGKLKK